MPNHRPSIIFFVNGAAALIVLYLVTRKMDPRPELSVVRAMIGVGLGIIALKVLLRYYGIDFPPRRHRR